MTPPSPASDYAFNTDRAVERLARILGDERPHPVDTEANDAVRDRLLAEIRREGFEPRVEDRNHCQPYGARMICARIQNIRFWVGSPGENAIMLGSHYDSVPTGPGAGDDGIGVAASLEIASILKDRDLARPVLVLITDGEEIGLTGAWSFVQNNPVAQLVSSVVNMEARGNAGPVAMFETSQPNGRDIAGIDNNLINANQMAPATNSLLADVYAAMPNGTDMTAFLSMAGVDGLNYAIASQPSFYHTPGDNLANLDRRSVFHLGSNALAATEAFLGGGDNAPDTPMTYANVLGLFVLSMPQKLAFILIAMGFVMSVVAFMRSDEPGPWRAFFMPPIALIAGTGFAILVTMGVALIRPEAFYAAANPWAIRGAQTGAALLGATLIIQFISHKEGPSRQRLSAWIWLAILGGALSYYFGGAAILFAPALTVAVFGSVFLLSGAQRLAQMTMFVAGLIFILFAVPMSAMGEMMLFPEGAAPFAIFAALAAILFLPPMAKPRAHPRWERLSARVPIGALLIAVGAFTLSAVLVPAYSPDAPRGLSVVHMTPSGGGDSYWRVHGDDPVPAAMNDVKTFSEGVPSDANAGGWFALSDDLPNAAITTSLEPLGKAADRRFALSIDAPAADRLTVQLTDSRRWNAIRVNGRDYEFSAGDTLRCHGRSCRDMQIEFTLTQDGTEPNSQDDFLLIEHVQYGLGAAGEALLSARPDWAMPQHGGDVRVQRLQLSVP